MLAAQSIANATDMIVITREAVQNLATRSKLTNVLFYCLNGGLSVFLVLLGGLFAGLTLAYMGQDQVYLQVIAESGAGNTSRDALKVLKVLQRGRHWVLVSLLLANVITNETLPIILDQDVQGGWVAVLASTVLIVIFGEIIPQSVCAKHGLAIGAWSSRYVLWLMYGLYPVAYPVSTLLDLLLGTSHGTFFNRAGFKVLAALQERRGYSTAEQLNREEVTVISSVLDLNETTVSAIMTPISKVFSLSLDADLNDATQNQILTAGFANIPVHRHEQPSTFVGVLSVKSLVAFDSQNDMAVGRMALGRLPVIPPDVSCQRTFGIFRDRKVEMALVTDRGTQHGQPLGIVTARDIMDELIGKQT